MARSSTPVSTACFSWKTERPFKDVSRKSCDFAFLGAKWCFEAKYSNKSSEMCYTITLKKKTGQVLERNCIDITTIVEIGCDSNRRGIVYCKRIFTVQTSAESIVWDYSEKNLTEMDCFFLSYGAWNIMCVFHDISSLELRIENMKDSSTQIGSDLETTVEKSTQVYQDLSDIDKLSDDFSNLLRLSLYPDAKLKSGDRIVPAHRSILAARSPVFNTMFQDESSDTYNVTDLDDETLDLLLKYAYSGTVQDLSDIAAVNLYRASQKYSMESLKKTCSDWMIAHITEQNCVSFLEASNASDDVPLVEAVALFLCDHPDVFSSSSWSKFAAQQPSLAYELLHRYTFRKK